jgi:hypothetical protein
MSAAELAPYPPSDAELRSILGDAKTVAIRRTRERLEAQG